MDDLGADSLDITELMMALEEEYEIEIDDDANRLETVGDAIGVHSGQAAGIDRPRPRFKGMLRI